MDDKNTSPTGPASASGLIQDLRAAVTIGRPLLHSDVDEIEFALAARQPVGQEPVPFAVESKAFEAHAASRKLDLSQHPLHYLFLDRVADEARQAWKAALAFAPPTQAVDLVRVRDSIQGLLNWIDDWAETPEESGLDPIAERALEVVAQIDAQVYAGEPNSAPHRLTGPAQPSLFYIQDTRQFVGNCPVWWGPNGGGYVTRLDEAGQYTEQEAITQNRTRESDIPWPCAEIDALARQTVDCQHMRPRVDRLAELALIDSQAVRNG